MYDRLLCSYMIDCIQSINSYDNCFFLCIQCGYWLAEQIVVHVYYRCVFRFINKYSSVLFCDEKIFIRIDLIIVNPLIMTITINEWMNDCDPFRIICHDFFLFKHHQITTMMGMCVCVSLYRLPCILIMNGFRFFVQHSCCCY